MQDKHEEGLSRRKFLAGAAAVGLGSAGALAVSPAWAMRAADSLSNETAPTIGEPMVAYVHDAAKGEVVLLVGEKEIVVQDRSLAAKLARCCEA